MIDSTAPAEPADLTRGDLGIRDDETADVMAAWRESIVNITNELGANGEDKAKTFDALNYAARKKMFEAAQEHYLKKLHEARNYVLARLAEDGKPTLTAQLGFFMYAEVGQDPNAWDLTEARKAVDAIAQFVNPGPAAA